MRLLSGNEAQQVEHFFRLAAEVAKRAKCLRAKCGSVVIKEGIVIGEGYNSLPGDETPEKCFKEELPLDFISDRTCCIHAEDRAVRDALAKYPDKVKGACIYFIRLDDTGKIAKAGKPYCTMCSKMTLDAGLKEFALWQEEGIKIYDTKEYNELSFRNKR